MAGGLGSAPPAVTSRGFRARVKRLCLQIARSHHDRAAVKGFGNERPSHLGSDVHLIIRGAQALKRRTLTLEPGGGLQSWDTRGREIHAARHFNGCDANPGRSAGRRLRYPPERGGALPTCGVCVSEPGRPAFCQYHPGGGRRSGLPRILVWFERVKGWSSPPWNCGAERLADRHPYDILDVTLGGRRLPLWLRGYPHPCAG